ncbi:hypothetical protein QFC21_006491 [Naganishia friedmannii]|uniref:Uncharacterized protein n=1 Tax=Naganishia friedmannii TaxID=89922 RepID=A0ACC2V1G5_9TREE|nr:hypothetical protein QFC21_006491 [Naganishia friedmannii]
MASAAAIKEESPAESSAMAQERVFPATSSSSSSSSTVGGKGKARTPSSLGPQPPPPHKPSIPHMYHSMLAGAGAGLVSSIATCPLDVIKTRLQASSAPGETVKNLLTTIYRTHGVRGLYRGLGPTILGYLPTWGIYFSVYDDIKDKLGKSIGSGGAGLVGVDGVVTQQGGSGGNEQWLVHILAAMTAGATGTIATNPLWVIKTRFMAQSIMAPNERRYAHTLDACRTIYREEGLGAFYKGLAPSLIGVTHVAVQFPLYEQLKVWAGTFRTFIRGTNLPPPPPPPGIANETSDPLSSRTILACSASSKMVASCVTYPHEVLRTRLQVHRTGPQGRQPQSQLHAPAALAPFAGAAVVPATDAIPRLIPVKTTQTPLTPPQTEKPTPRGLVAEFKYILKNDGLKGFYRGLSINLVRTVPSNAVTMLT